MKYILFGLLPVFSNGFLTTLNPLTHSIEYFMDFHDNTSPYRTDPVYLVAKQCADSNLQ